MVMGDLCVCVYVLACGDLSLSSGRYIWREPAAFLTTFTHSEGVEFNASTAIPCFGDDEFLKLGTELYSYNLR